MGFKDIDFRKLAMQSSMSFNLNKEIAVINAKADKDLKKVELLTGVQLEQIDPIYEALKLEKARKKQKPITEKLSEIAERTSTVNELTNIMKSNTPPAIDYNRLGEIIAQLQPSLQEQQTNEREEQILEGDIDKGIDEDVLKKYQFPRLSNAIKNQTVEELQDFQKTVGKTTKQVAGISARDESMVRDKEVLMSYNSRLKNIIKEHSVFTVKKDGKGFKNSKKYGGSLYYTNVSTLKKRMQILLGEIQAGNNSRQLLNELADVCHHLYKNKKITRTEYRQILSHINR